MGGLSVTSKETILALSHQSPICRGDVSVKSKLLHSPPPPLPRAIPQAFEFLENFCSHSPLTTPKSCSNTPTPGKITILLF